MQLIASLLVWVAAWGIVTPLPLSATRSESFVTAVNSACTTCSAQNWAEMTGCIESAPADCDYVFYTTVPVYTDCYRDNFITFRYYTPSHNYTDVSTRRLGSTDRLRGTDKVIIDDQDHYGYWYNLKFRIAGMKNQTFAPAEIRIVDLRDTESCSFHSSQTLSLWSIEGDYIVFRQVPEDTNLQLIFDRSDLDLSQAHMEIIGKYMHAANTTAVS